MNEQKYIKFQNKRVLISPLDWGLGHATRCIPVIKQLMSMGNTVLIGSNGMSQFLLKDAFPELQHINSPSLKVNYGEGGIGTLMRVLFQIPYLLRFIQRDKNWLAQVIDKYSIDVVISDNRYGLYNEKVESILITHQLRIKKLGFETFSSLLLAGLINQFDQVWIPDLESGSGLTGQLSESSRILIPLKRIGVLSRFLDDGGDDYVDDVDVLVLISGPEPQRTLMSDYLTEEFRNASFKTQLLEGLPGLKRKLVKGNVTISNHLKTSALRSLINKAKLVICRSGYSSVMDMYVMQKAALLVPTLGQPEQLYLSQYLKGKFAFDSVMSIKEIKKESIEKMINYQQ